MRRFMVGFGGIVVGQLLFWVLLVLAVYHFGPSMGDGVMVRVDHVIEYPGP